jgi:transposase
MGLALGGAAATRLSHLLNYGQSRNTFLNLLSKLSLPAIATPKVVGVDDFALRKGQQYGTILVDLEQRCPIALLPDRTAATLQTWLSEHPGIEILSRDRSKTYKRAMSNGAPNAIQVADRFHLLHNLEEALEKDFKGKSHVLKQIEKAHLTTIGQPVQPQVSQDAQSARQLQQQQKRAERLENYEHVHRLRQQGHPVTAIAHHLGMGVRTVYTYLSYPTFPEWQPTVQRRRRRMPLDDYKPYLNQQWQQGRHSSKALFEDIQRQGYPGSYMSVTRYTRTLRPLKPDLPLTLVGLEAAPSRNGRVSKPLSARRAAWLVLQRDEQLTTEDAPLLEQMRQHSALSESISLTQGFLRLVRQRLPDQLDDWIEQAENSSIQSLQRFANGLKDDYDAVKAGLTLEISNGQVEGQNNRLKMLKRQMFGRAGLDLLAKRLILNR